MVKWIKDNIFNVIGILPIVGAVVVGVLAWLQHISWYLIAFYGITIAVIVFFGIERIDVWKERHKKKLTQLSDKEIADTLRKWFDKRHYSSSSRIDDKALFLIVATDTQNRNLNVFKPKENPSVIAIRLAIKEEQIALIPQPHQNMARFNITIEMARLGLLCHGAPPMYIDQELQCDDFLTESSFWKAIDKIRQGHVLIDAHLTQALIVAKTEKQNPPSIEQVPDKKDSET